MNDSRLDDDLKKFFSGRQDVPPHVKAQISERLHSYGEAESNRWVGIMVVCSFVCMLALAWVSWFFFGWIMLGILAGFYYFMTISAAVSALLIRRVSL